MICQRRTAGRNHRRKRNSAELDSFVRRSCKGRVCRASRPPCGNIFGLCSFAPVPALCTSHSACPPIRPNSASCIQCCLVGRLKYVGHGTPGDAKCVTEFLGGQKKEVRGGEFTFFVSRENKRTDLLNKCTDVNVKNALKLTYKHL